jgi:PEP-CTERM motif
MMNRTTLLRGLSVLCVLCGVALHSRADIAVTLQRISDTEAIMTVVGSLVTAPPDSNDHALFLSDPFQIRPGPTANTWVLDTSDLRAGSYAFNFANEAGSEVGVNSNRPPGTPGITGFGNTIYFGNNTFVTPGTFQPIPTQVPFAGSLALELTSGSTFAPIGSKGDVYWGITLTQISFPSGSGFTQQDKGVLAGTWEMVGALPVPEPTAAAMWVVGLGALGGIAWRRRSAAGVSPTTRRPRARSS